jgi:NAD(P)-dependent dehydrogenase (short-subunit alcohol dehydrogenase family)
MGLLSISHNAARDHSRCLSGSRQTSPHSGENDGSVCVNRNGGVAFAAVANPQHRAQYNRPMANIASNVNIKKTLLLTGASRGIGHATVKHFHAAEWRVITVSRQPFDKICPWPQGEKDHIQLDLNEMTHFDDVIARVKSKLAEPESDGKLAALVNNAAISPKLAGGKRMGSLDTGIATWQNVFNVNLFSTALLARGLFDELKAAQGSVVNVTSIAGGKVHPFAGVAYATSKAALAALTREMAHDFAPYGVRCNAIAPGEIDTSILSPGTDQIVENEIPMKRLGKPSEVAQVIYFLCTSQSSYVNGAEIHVNGGEHV